MNILEFIQRVQAISKVGLLFSKDPYAIENYQELQRLSTDFLNREFDLDVVDNIFTRDIYPTVNVSCRTVVFNDKQQVLMVKEMDEQLYSFPGGWCDIGVSPQENAKREVFEESGIVCEIESLVAVFFRDLYKKSNPNLISEYVIYFKAKAIGGSLNPNHEIEEAGFYDLNQLPPLSFKNSPEEVTRVLAAIKNNSNDYD